MKYSEFASSVGFKEVEGIFVREELGFQVYFKDWQYMVLNIQSFYIPLDKPLDKKELSRLESAAYDNVGAMYTIASKNDTLIISLPEKSKTNPKIVEIINNAITRVCKLLKVDGYGPMKTCPVCHQEGQYHAFGDDFVPLHEECKSKYIEGLKLKIKEDEGFNIKYIYSLLLSLFASLLGLVPALLLAIFTKGYFTPVIVLSPILNILSLILVKAPYKKWLKYVTASLSTISIIIFTILILPYLALQNDMTLGTYLVTNGVGIRKIIFSLIIALASFGMIRYLDKFKKDNQKELEKFAKNC